MSYFNDIAILDIGDNYRYFIYHDDEQEPEIILRCNSNDMSEIYRFVLTQIFSDSSFWIADFRRIITHKNYFLA